MYLGCLRAGAVEEDSQEADGDVKNFTRYLVFVNLSLSVAGSSRMLRVYSRMTATLGG
jgi:hypothetical protein